MANEFSEEFLEMDLLEADAPSFFLEILRVTVEELIEEQSSRKLFWEDERSWVDT